MCAVWGEGPFVRECVNEGAIMLYYDEALSLHYDHCRYHYRRASAATLAALLLLRYEPAAGEAAGAAPPREGFVSAAAAS